MKTNYKGRALMLRLPSEEVRRKFSIITRIKMTSMNKVMGEFAKNYVEENEHIIKGVKWEKEGSNETKNKNS